MGEKTDLPNMFNAATYFVGRNVEKGRGAKTAILYQGQKTTYDEVYRNVNRVGNALKQLGIRMENRVLLLLVDCPEFVYSFFGSIKIGAVPVPTNTLLTPADYEYALNDSRAVAIIVSGELISKITPIRLNLPYLQHIIVLGRAEAGQIAFEEIVRQASDELVAARTCKDDAAFWLYSSGTTGFPKGTVHLQHDMVYCAENYAQKVLGIDEDDITFSVAKLFFAYGLGNGLYFPFSVGGTTILSPEHPSPQHVFEVINKYRPTLFFGVPTSYNAMLQVPEAEKNYDLSSIRLCVSAGESLPKAVYERWRDKFGVEILDGIGSTEVLHIYISNRSGGVKPGSTGTVVPGYEVKIVDDNGVPLPQGKVGNLMVKGDSTAAFYWNKHDRSKQTFLGEWFNTGDQFYQDEDGYFWYAGRGDDMIKAGGIWVSPVEVESTLMTHPAVLECGVIGKADADGLIKPKAFITLKEGFEPSPELETELKQFVKSKIAPYKYPRWIEFVDELPKTATGKIQRFKLRQKA